MKYLVLVFLSLVLGRALKPSTRLVTTRLSRLAESNVDLFASSKTRPAVLTNPLANQPTGGKKFPNGPSTKKEEIAMQAELLRLEANQEQSQIDAQLIFREKERLMEIDRVLLKLIDEEVLIDEALCRDYPQFLSTETFFRIAELVNAASTTEEKDRISTYFNQLMDTIKAFDSNLHADIQGDIEKSLKQRQFTRDAAKRESMLDVADKSTGDGAVQTYDEEVVKGWMEQLHGADRPVPVSAPTTRIERDFEEEHNEQERERGSKSKREATEATEEKEQ